MTICDECQGEKFIECQGDWTCMSCGLVQMSGLLDETAEWTETYTEYATTVYDKSLKKLILYQQPITCADKMRKILRDAYNHTLYDKTLIDIATSYYERTVKMLTNKTRQRPIMAACTYLASLSLRRGLKLDDVIYPFHQNKNDIWPLLTELLVLWSKSVEFRKNEVSELKGLCFSHADKIIRIVHQSCRIPDDFVWKVIMITKKLYNQLKSCPRMTTLKSNTLIASCIYVACMMVNFPVSKQVFCGWLNISITSLNNQECVIQQLLSGLVGTKG